jgi:hypothetical protein
VSKGLFKKIRVDVTTYDRRENDFADDDLLLNTGVSFPIAFSRAEIHGTEVKLDLMRWHGFSGFLSYSYMMGTGYLPVTGGLFVGDEAASALDSSESFAVTQDQRHSLRGRLGLQVTPRLWIATQTSYGSGLPFEFTGSPEDARAQYGDRIVEQVDFETGRLKANFSLDASIGFELARTRNTNLRLQADLINLTNRLNVIDFAGLFSGTAIGAPRSYAVRISADF